MSKVPILIENIYISNHRVEKWSCKVGSGRVLWVWVVYMGGQTSGDVTDAGRTTTMGGRATELFIRETLSFIINGHRTVNTKESKVRHGAQQCKDKAYLL